MTTQAPHFPRLLLKVVVMSLVATALERAPAHATPFVLQRVDSAGIAGLDNSLALDSRGNPHIAYFDDTNDDLKYATRRFGTWVIETVDAANAGRYASLALNLDGEPCISYYDIGNADLKYAERRGGIWASETVEATGFVGEYTSLAFDPSGNPHISYYHAGNADLKLAVRRFGSWSFTTVDAAGSVGKYSSIKVDAFGNPHISYHDETNTSLKYATSIDGTWATWTIENTGFVGLYTSLALDSQGRPSISYMDLTTLAIKFARNTGTIASWVWETVASTFVIDTGQSSLVIDASGTAHISYNTDGRVEYARKTGSVWTAEVIDNLVASVSSLALDAQGNPCLSYFRNGVELRFADSGVRLLAPLGGERWASGSTQIVRWSGSGTVDIQLSTDGGAQYTTLVSAVSQSGVAVTIPASTTQQARIRINRASPHSSSDSPADFSIAPDLVGPWWSTTVDPAGFMGWYTSLALDAQGSPRISYYDLTNLDLRYATRNGENWSVETVDATGDVGAYTSLALDAQGNPRISYWDYTNLRLRLASKTAGSWSYETVVGPGVSGQSTSLAVDAQGNPHVAYYDGPGGDLEYAHKAGVVWLYETAEAVGNVGFDPSLALDAEGNPHFAYRDVTNSDLRYTTKYQGTWYPKAVDTRGDVGSFSSLALDAHGNPHIAYFDNTNSDLRYAHRVGDAWTIETVDAAGSVGQHASLVLDSQGNPRICYYDLTNGDLKYAAKIGDIWVLETVDGLPLTAVGAFTSLALDAQDTPRISYFDDFTDDLKYASAAVELAEPAAGVVWPVGASRTVTWDGTGRVELYLSVDGGDTWSLQQPDLSGGRYRLQVPHTPSRFGRYKLERAVPYSVALSERFTIETSVSLLAFAVAQAPGGGADLSWNTDPGPTDLAGYRLERSDGASDGWRTVIALTRATTHHDPAGAAGSHYRLFAVNGLGEELMVGEASLLPARPLAVWPQPYRGGELSMTFATFGGLGGGRGDAEIALLDVSGRRIATLAKGAYAAGQHQAAWDGRTASGRRLSAGIYFVRLETGGQAHDLKLVVMP